MGDLGAKDPKNLWQWIYSLTQPSLYLSRKKKKKILITLSRAQPVNPYINLWLGAVFSG